MASRTVPPAPGPLLVMGAGAVGGWLGGRLQAAGVPVSFVGRARMLQAWRDKGLTLSDLDGFGHTLAPRVLALHESVPAGSAPALVLLCVKSGATAQAAAELQRALPAGSPVVAMQNGVSNAVVARTFAPGLTVLPGMVGFNVAEVAPGHLHRATSGELAAQDHPALRAWQAVFAAAGLPLALHADLSGVLWGKLLLNLNNAVNALSGLPLRAQLMQRDYRLCMAALVGEALHALRVARIRPAKLTPLPPAWMPALLHLPTPLFRVIAARMLRIDPQARSSMAADLALGRPTEVDALNGEVVRLARRHGGAAPLNARIAELVQAWPQQPRAWPARELRAALGA